MEMSRLTSLGRSESNDVSQICLIVIFGEFFNGTKEG